MTTMALTWTKQRLKFESSLPVPDTLYVIILKFNLDSAFSYRFHELLKNVRQNKGSILIASVEYVRLLKKEQQRWRDLELRMNSLEMQNRRMRDKLQVEQKGQDFFLLY